MNWLDTETKAILRKEPEPKSAPSKAAEFALVLIRKGMDDQRLVRASRRINECGESEAIELSRLPTPVTINPGLTERFVDQFLGGAVSHQKQWASRFSVQVPYKKARIMKHWATRAGAEVRGDAVDGLGERRDDL